MFNFFKADSIRNRILEEEKRIQNDEIETNNLFDKIGYLILAAIA